MKLAIALVFLVVASVAFHFLSPWWFTPLASNWGAIDDTINITFWVTGFVFIAVNLFIAYAVYRFRYSKTRKAAYEPENKKLESWLTGLTALGVAAMLAPGLIVWAQFIDVPEDAAVIEAVGQQWQWSFRLPGKDGKMGAVDNRLVSAVNPFGINPKDALGHDDILVSSNEIHLPINQPVKVLLRSKDVLHDFAVPQFRVKMDLIPGTVSYFWFTPTKKGSFEILCQELCGIAHHTMRGKVVVEDNESYQAWLSSYPTYAQTQLQSPGDATKGQQQYAICSGCHGAEGEGNVALNAPPLGGQGSWYLKRQLNYFKTGVRGAHEEDVYGKQMAPMAGILVDDTAINNVAAYISSLTPKSSKATISGNAEHGRALYRTCATCHGTQGKGNIGLNAPQLAGQADWYLKRQLQHYQQGIRGKHAKDNFGVQMILMANILKDEQELDDLITYINTL